MIKKIFAITAILTFSPIFGGAVAFADVLQSVIVAPGTNTIVEGGSTDVTYKIVATGGDGESGCNATIASPATINISAPAGVTLSVPSVVLTACSTDSAPVTVSSALAGDYSITASVSDSGAGTYNTTPAAFTLHVTAAPVVVIDTDAPTLHLPADMTAVEATSASGAVVTYTATADDVTPVHPVVTCNIPSGSTFPLGTTVVSCSATDAANNTANGSFSVTVVDITAPTLPVHVSPADNTFTTTALQQLIDWTDSTDAVSAVTYMYESSYSSDINGFGAFSSAAYGPAPVANSQIATGGTPEGVYYWHVKAVDAAGNESVWTDAWKITVDNTAPEVVINAPVAGSYPLNYVLVADYECTDANLATCIGDVADGASIDTSSVGMKTFTVTATDKSGNTTTQVVHYSVGYDPTTFAFGSPVSLTSKEYKSKSTIPVKFTINDFLGNPYALASATLQICKGLNCSIAVVASGNSNTGNAFRYDSSAGQYIYNLSTKTALSAGSYDLKITIDGNPPLVQSKAIVIK